MLQVDWGALMTASRCSARRFGQAQGGLLLHACGTEVSERDSPSPLGSTIKPLYFPPTGDQSYVLGRLDASYAPSWHVKTNCLGLALEAWQCGIAPIKSQMRGNVPCSREGPHLQGELPAATCSPVPRGRKKLGRVSSINLLFLCLQLLPHLAKDFPNCGQESHTFLLL